VDAQLATARLGGTRLAEHPRVQAAVEGEKKIRSDLHGELLTAIRGAEAEVRLGQGRVTATRSRLTNVHERLARLADRRAEYSNRVAAVDNSRITLDRARQNLSTAKAAQAAARSGSLVTRIDQPETGPYPAGPGRTTITGAGAIGGLMLGLGLVFLTTGPTGVAPSREPLLTAATRKPQRRQTKPKAGVSSAHTPLVATRTTPPEPVEELWPAKTPPVVVHHAPEHKPSAASTDAPQTPSQPKVVSEPATAELEVTDQPVDPSSGTTSTHEPAWSTTYATSVEAEPHDLLVAVAPAVAVVEEPRFAEAVAVVKPPLAPAPVIQPEPAAPMPVVQAPQQRVASSPQPTKKTVLPTATGSLPSAGGKLPPLSTSPAANGMSLQEALQAARQSQR
jgi:hypothetical protein